jgi:heme/copper-type cytochrome/quinol oxidase subunit 2
MEGLTTLHLEIWAIILFVAGFVLYMGGTAVYSLYLEIAAGCYKDQTLIQIVATFVPVIILCAIPAANVALLHCLNETLEAGLTMGTVEREWYWSYEYGDCDSDSCISMASPNEPNSGWFSSIKNYWGFGKDNKPLSPLETNQKNLDILENAQHSTLGHCKKYDDSLIDGSLSPRSHGIVTAKREECYFHYNALFKCSSQIAKNIGSTDYSSPPNTFSGAFGNALGQKVGAATEPLYTEMAQAAVKTTAEALNKR